MNILLEIEDLFSLINLFSKGHTQAISAGVGKDITKVASIAGEVAQVAALVPIPAAKVLEQVATEVDKVATDLEPTTGTSTQPTTTPPIVEPLGAPFNEEQPQ